MAASSLRKRRRVASTRRARRQHRARQFAETNAHERRPLTPSAEHDAVPVGEKRAPLAARKRDWPLAPAESSSNEPASSGVGPDCVPLPSRSPVWQVAAVDRVVRDHL